MRALGFDGPFAGSRHHFLTIGHHRLAIPSNPEYSVPKPRMMVREAEELLGREIPLDEWERL